MKRRNLILSVIVLLLGGTGVFLILQDSRGGKQHELVVEDHQLCLTLRNETETVCLDVAGGTLFRLDLWRKRGPSLKIIQSGLPRTSTFPEKYARSAGIPLGTADFRFENNTLIQTRGVGSQAITGGISFVRAAEPREGFALNISEGEAAYGYVDPAGSLFWVDFCMNPQPLNACVDPDASLFLVSDPLNTCLAAVVDGGILGSVLVEPDSPPLPCGDEISVIFEDFNPEGTGDADCISTLTGGDNGEGSATGLDDLPPDCPVLQVINEELGEWEEVSCFSPAVTFQRCGAYLIVNEPEQETQVFCFEGGALRISMAGDRFCLFQFIPNS